MLELDVGLSILDSLIKYSVTLEHGFEQCFAPVEADWATCS